ncbi:ABC transporter transmembrane region [Pilibacter termitis]|uniref:ABC transporter transmembrane region n=2 Tax=Pilibacter termitis TaxID=263852 RepID=A0A1T4N8R7_9ENTE|nr:ABC transporter transmembrane region [Pilibacter termitis]
MVMQMIILAIQKHDLKELTMSFSSFLILSALTVIGLTGKRIFYAKIDKTFKYELKAKVFEQLLKQEKSENALSLIENDVNQLSSNYLEPFVIILSAIGTIVISMSYILYTNLLIGAIFVASSAVISLFNGIGVKKLNHLSEEKSRYNAKYFKRLQDFFARKTSHPRLSGTGFL